MEASEDERGRPEGSLGNIRRAVLRGGEGGHGGSRRRSEERWEGPWQAMRWSEEGGGEDPKC